MIFEVLHEAAKRKELILWDGGMCHYHVRRDGQITICEIIVLPDRQRQGVGTRLLEALKGIAHVLGCTSILAKCPSDLPANGWYEHKGFTREATERTKSGRGINVWRLAL